MGPEASAQTMQVVKSADPAVAATAIPRAAPNLSAASRSATKSSVAGATPEQPTAVTQAPPPLIASPAPAPAPVAEPATGSPAPAAGILAKSLPISPVSQQVNDAMNGVSADRRTVADALTVSKTPQEFEQKKVDFLAQQQFAAENADARARVRDTPATSATSSDWFATRKKIGQALLAGSNPVFALKYATGKDTVAEAAGVAAGVSAKSAGYSAAKAKQGLESAWNLTKNGLSNMGDNFAKGWAEGAGTPDAAKQVDRTAATATAANLDTAKNVVVTLGADLTKAKSTPAPVPLPAMKTEAGLAKTYEAVGQAVAAETPDQRMVNDLNALHTATTRGKSVDKAMAVARLVKSGALPGQALANYLQSGVLSFDDVEAAAREMRARAAMMQYQQLSTKYTMEQRAELQKQYKESMGALVQPALADIANENPMLLQRITGGSGSGKYKTPATGVKPEALLYGLTDGLLRDPTTAQLLVPGWNGEPPEVLSPDQLRQAMQMVTAYMRDPKTGVGGKEPWLFSEGAPNGLIADSQSFTEFVVRQARNTKGDR